MRLAFASLSGILCLPLPAQLTYLDADFATNTTPTDAVTTTDVGGDNLWWQRGFGTDGTIFEASGNSGNEDAPELATVVSGLDPGRVYQFWVNFYDPENDNVQNWNIRAGFTPGNLTLFANDDGGAAALGATPSVPASSLTYNVAPKFDDGGTRMLEAGFLGYAIADASGEVTIYIDDQPSDVFSNERSWYDGISHELAPDEDMDGLPDDFELAHTDPPSATALNPGDDLELSGGGDGLDNLAEFLAGTDPNNEDSDDDGLWDGAEVNATLNDLTTPSGYAATDPLDADSDDDGAGDGDEVTGALNVQFGEAPTDPNALDSDGDGMDDGYELSCNSSPATALDPNDDGSGDPTQAPDGNRDAAGGDTLTNFEEYDPTTGPNTLSPRTRADLADTDGDGYLDHVEDNFGSWDGPGFTGTDPTNPDSDGDGLADGDERFDLGSFQGSGVTPAWCDPNDPDSDLDQWTDGYEVNVAGTDPLDEESAPVQPAGFTLVEDFEGPGMTVGETYKGVNGWQSDDEAAEVLVASEPIGGGDQVGGFIKTVAGGNLLIHKSLSDLGLQILDGRTGTIFLQVYTGVTGIDHSLGLSDIDTPGWFTDFEAQTAMIGADPTVVGTRGNSGFRAYAGGGYRVGEWMNVWIVADNELDVVKVYYESPAGETGQVDITGDSATTPYVFRNGGTFDPLATFMVIENAAEGLPFYIDNIYVDPTSANLTTPAAAKPLPGDTPEITAVFFEAGDLKISFSPGGPGYILTSSNDLVSPFTEETDAIYDNVDTFTVPQAFLNPGQDYFRVETP